MEKLYLIIFLLHSWAKGRCFAEGLIPLLFIIIICLIFLFIFLHCFIKCGRGFVSATTGPWTYTAAQTIFSSILMNICIVLYSISVQHSTDCIPYTNIRAVHN